MMKKIVDNSSETEKLNLINAHPELGKKLQKKEKLTKFSEDEQKSAGLDQCSDEEFEILTCLLYTSPSPRDATLSRMPSSA